MTTKSFGKKIKHFFLSKGLQTNSIICKGKNKLVTDSQIKTLNLKPMPKSTSFSDLLKPYEDHFSVLKIKEKYKIRKRFHTKKIPVQRVSLDKARKFIQSLNKKKSAISSCITVKHLTESVDIYPSFLTVIINQFLQSVIFPDELNLVELISLFDKIN